MCGKITLCFIKVRIILIVCTNIDVHKKPSHLQKKLYDQVHFDRRDTLNLSMDSCDTWSDNSGQTN